MGNPQVTEFELGWLIGIFDGEGCFTISRHGSINVKYTVGIKFVNTNSLIIDEVCRLLEALEIKYCKYNSWRTSNQKAAQRVEINTLDQIKKFLDILLPRMYCRVTQAKIVKDFVEVRLGRAQKAPYGIEEQILYHAIRQEND